MAIATINPATGETVKTFDEMSEADVERCLAAAAATHASYRLTSFDDRARWMRRAAEILDDEQDQIAAMMTTEMGKTLAAARQEVAKCARACRYYAEHAAEFLADEPADAAAVGASTRLRQLPAARAGPGDHAVELPALAGHALRRAGPDGGQRRAAQARVERAADRAVPAGPVRQGRLSRTGTFQTLLVGSARVEPILRDDAGDGRDAHRIRAAGQSVAAIAGSEIKKVVLELGGSDPFIVMPSADLPAAAQVAAFARCLNNGQSCIAAKRFIVHDAVYDEFERLFVEEMSAKVVGDPMLDSTDVGPLASEQQRDDVEKLVADAVARRHRCCAVAPRRRPRLLLPTDRPGQHHPRDARVRRGGVRPGGHPLPGRRTSTRRSSSPTPPTFGLGANAWTNDEAERSRFIRDLAAGMVFINGNVTSYPQLPFGGIKTLRLRPGTIVATGSASSATSSPYGSARPVAVN